MKYLVLNADSPFGRGVRGRTLYRFLRIYHGRRQVGLLSTDDLLRGREVTTDVLFIGMPTRFSDEHLRKVRFRQAVLFDYEDSDTLRWDNSNRELLTSLTDQYWKAWVEPHWDYEMQLGLLPIRRFPYLTWLVGAMRLFGRLYATDNERPFDTMFLGTATGMRENSQRVAWLNELRANRDRISFWGGLVMPKRTSLANDELGGIRLHSGRASFWNYFQHLRQAKTALTPAGFARWSYRQYEAIYAGAIPVTTDFRSAKTLIPLPPDAVVHVPDGASVIPAVEQALRLRAENPELPRENIRFLERFLTFGDYSRSKPALMDRIQQQLDSPQLANRFAA